MAPEQARVPVSIVQNDVVPDVQFVRVRVLSCQLCPLLKLTSCASPIMIPTIRSR